MQKNVKILLIFLTVWTMFWVSIIKINYIPKEKEIDYHCGWMGESPCDVETINNVHIRYYKEEKRIEIISVLHSNEILTSAYVYKLNGNNVYAIGDLSYVDGAVGEPIDVLIYSSDEEDFHSIAIPFSDKKYLPKLVKIDSKTGQFVLYKKLADVPESEKNIFLEMIKNKNLKLEDLEVEKDSGWYSAK